MKTYRDRITNKLVGYFNDGNDLYMCNQFGDKDEQYISINVKFEGDASYTKLTYIKGNLSLSGDEVLLRMRDVRKNSENSEYYIPIDQHGRRLV